MGSRRSKGVDPAPTQLKFMVQIAPITNANSHGFREDGTDQTPSNKAEKRSGGVPVAYSFSVFDKVVTGCDPSMVLNLPVGLLNRRTASYSDAVSTCIDQ